MAASSPRTVHGEAMFAAEMEVDMNEQASSEVSSTVWGVGGGGEGEGGNDVFPWQSRFP